MHVSTQRDAVRVAMWTVIATEAVMFAALIAMRGGPRLAPSIPALGLAAAVALALFGAGSALRSAVRRTRDGQGQAAGRLLAMVCALGLAALCLELGSARAFGGTDPLARVVIGLHAAHVAAAIALATWVLTLVRCGRVDRREHGIIGLVAAYWYFVAAVWVFVWPVFSAPRA